jgi:hypothetical protein
MGQIRLSVSRYDTWTHLRDKTTGILGRANRSLGLVDNPNKDAWKAASLLLLESCKCAFAQPFLGDLSSGRVRRAGR